MSISLANRLNLISYFKTKIDKNEPINNTYQIFPELLSEQIEAFCCLNVEEYIDNLLLKIFHATLKSILFGEYKKKINKDSEIKLDDQIKELTNEISNLKSQLGRKKNIFHTNINNKSGYMSDSNFRLEKIYPQEINIACYEPNVELYINLLNNPIKQKKN